MRMGCLIPADDSAADSAAASPAAPWPTTIRCLGSFVMEWGSRSRSFHEITPFRAGTLFHGRQPCLIVRFVDDLGWQNDLFWQRLIFDLTNSGARRHASDLEHIEVDSSENFAGFDFLYCWEDAVNAYDRGRA